MKPFAAPPLRAIRSFVIREGRFTRAQKKAFDCLWPQYGIALDDARPLALNDHFNSAQPLVLDIGFGNGDSLISLARQRPDINVVGVEVYRPGIGAALGKIQALAIDNIRIIHADAATLVTGMIAADALLGVMVWFPDPWPKQRHHKRRLLQANFFNQLARVIEPGGILHLASDWQDYVDDMMGKAGRTPAFVLRDTCRNPLNLQRPPTRFEQRGLRFGHKVTDLIYELKK